MKRIIIFLLIASSAFGADFGDIPVSLTMGAGTSIRRNASNTDFEAYTPGAGVSLFTDLDFTASNITSIEDRSYNDLQDLPTLFTQGAADLLYVPLTRTVNGHALSSNVTVTPTDLSLVIGTNVQAYDSDLTAIAALATDSFGRDLLIKTSAANVRSYIGAGTGSLSGSITDKQIAFGDGTDIAGENAFQWDSDAQSISIGTNYSALNSNTPGIHIGTNPGGFGAELSLGSDDENTGAPSIRLYSSNGTIASPTASADGNTLSQILFHGYTTNNTFAISTEIEAQVSGTVTATYVPGVLNFKVRDDAGALQNGLVLDGGANEVKIGLLTNNGFVKTSGGDGTLSIDTASYQPLDGDLTSWAGVTRASGFDTFTTTPSSANLRGLLTDESGTGVFLTANGSAASLTSFPTFNQSTTGSAASLSITGQTALLTFTGPTGTNRAKAVRDAADTILELGGSYTPLGTWTSLTMVTPVLGTPTSGNLANCTFPTLNQNTTGSAAILTTARNLWGQSFDGSAAIGGNIELGTAGTTDTTFARASAGVGSIEGSNILLASGLGSITEAWDTQLDSLAGLAYTGNTLKVVRVNAGETGFELAAAGGGSGTVTNTGGNLTSNSVVLGAGTVDTKVVAGIITDGTSQLTLGVNTTTIGKVKMFGNTSGDATIQPTAAAGTATVVTLPNASSTLPIFGQQITFTGPTAARSIALPDAAFTVARTDAANTFVGSHIFGSATSLLLGTAGTAVGDIGFRNATSGTATLAPPTGALGTYSVTLPNAASTLPIFGQQITWAGPTAARTITVPDASFTVVGTSATQTLSSKRYIPRTNATASTTSWTPDFDTYDEEIQTALAGALTVNAPTYTSANEGEERYIRLKDNGTARAITWTTGSSGQFRASTDLTLPTTTTLSKTMLLKFKYNNTDSRWDFVAKLDNF